MSRRYIERGQGSRSRACALLNDACPVPRLFYIKYCYLWLHNHVLYSHTLLNVFNDSAVEFSLYFLFLKIFIILTIDDKIKNLS